MILSNSNILKMYYPYDPCIRNLIGLFLMICRQIIWLYECQKLHAYLVQCGILNCNVSCDSRLCLTIARSDE